MRKVSSMLGHFFWPIYNHVALYESSSLNAKEEISFKLGHFFSLKIAKLQSCLALDLFNKNNFLKDRFHVILTIELSYLNVSPKQLFWKILLGYKKWDIIYWSLRLASTYIFKQIIEILMKCSSLMANEY